MDLSEVADKRAAFYSGGMKKRLDLASALVHKPKLLFLDEPTAGLDPQSRNGIWKYLEKMNQNEGITIFLTTQYMEEADRLCRNLSIIDHGQIVVRGSPAELKRQIGGDTISLSLPGDADSELKDKSRRTAESVQGIDKVIETENGLAVYAKNASNLIPQIVRAFDQNDVSLPSVNLSSPSLMSFYNRQEEESGRRSLRNHPLTGVLGEG